MERVRLLHWFNSKTSRQSGISGKAQGFWKLFYFPGFTEHLIEETNYRLTYMQLKRANGQHHRLNLQTVSMEQSFSGDMMQVHVIGPLESPIYKYALSGIDVFQNTSLPSPSRTHQQIQ